MVGANSKSIGAIAPTIHGMIDAHAHYSSRITWPLELSYLLENGELKLLKEVVNEKFHDANQGKTTVEMGNVLANLNTEMYNQDNSAVSFQDGKIVDERDKKDIPSLIIAATMDMEFAHLRGYYGETIPRGSKYPYRGWEIQIKDTETATTSNPLRILPLLCYDPRRNRLPNDDSPGENTCRRWDEPFKRIVGHCDSAGDINKIWLGFYMNPALGFRPFDEFCEHLPKFYKECEKNNTPIPILAHCVPGGITAQGVEDYTDEPNERIEKSKERHKMILNEKLSTYQGDALCSSMYCGEEQVIGDDKYENLDYFYKNYGHPRNWIPVLEYFPKLHLCLTGFGGNREWQLADWPDGNALPTREWIRCIIKLTAKYDNVYADISGLNIYDKKIRSGLREMLDLIQSGHKSFEHMKYKLIFGSGWYLTHIMDMSNSTESLSHSYGDYCREFKRLFYSVDKSGELWERVSLINPWNFYGLSKQKFKDMHKVLPGADDEENISSKTLRVLVELDDYVNDIEKNDDVRENDVVNIGEPEENIGYYRNPKDARIAAAIQLFEYTTDEIEHSISIFAKDNKFYLTQMKNGTVNGRITPDYELNEHKLTEIVHSHAENENVATDKELSAADMIISYEKEVPVSLVTSARKLKTIIANVNARDKRDADEIVVILHNLNELDKKTELNERDRRWLFRLYNRIHPRTSFPYNRIEDFIPEAQEHYEVIMEGYIIHCIEEPQNQLNRGSFTEDDL
jgi:hypothetical protein